jgi:hypothetical protein
MKNIHSVGAVVVALCIGFAAGYGVIFSQQHDVYVTTANMAKAEKMCASDGGLLRLHAAPKDDGTTYAAFCMGSAKVEWQEGRSVVVAGNVFQAK